MPIKFAVQIVRLKVCMTIASLLTMSLFKVTSASEAWLLLTCNISDNIQAITFKLGMTVDIDAIYAHARFDDLDLETRSQWVK